MSLGDKRYDFTYRKDHRMALVTMSTTEEAIDALIVSFK